MRLKAEDIAFFILIGLILFVAFWLLHGSPLSNDALVSIAIFFASSEIFLWRKVFQVDKNTAVGFEKVKNDLDSFRKDMGFGFEVINTKLKNIEGRLVNIENLIKKK